MKEKSIEIKKSEEMVYEVLDRLKSGAQDIVNGAEIVKDGFGIISDDIMSLSSVQTKVNELLDIEDVANSLYDENIKELSSKLIDYLQQVIEEADEIIRQADSLRNSFDSAVEAYLEEECEGECEEDC